LTLYPLLLIDLSDKTNVAPPTKPISNTTKLFKPIPRGRGSVGRERERFDYIDDIRL
jgi:hypothetical protein